MHKVFEGRVICNQHGFLLFLFFLSKPHGVWDLSSLTRGLTHTASIGIAESRPLDHQGSHKMEYF